jgi:DEAD/DEAH box helicase domain-containing protein
MKKTVFFDLETQKSDQEVGGWEYKEDMLLSAAVTYNTADGYYHTYLEEDVGALIEELIGADMVVGFNVKRFDYAVLAHYTKFNLSTLRTVNGGRKMYQMAV